MNVVKIGQHVFLELSENCFLVTFFRCFLFSFPKKSFFCLLSLSTPALILILSTRSDLLIKMNIGNGLTLEERLAILLSGGRGWGWNLLMNLCNGSAGTAWLVENTREPNFPLPMQSTSTVFQTEVMAIKTICDLLELKTATVYLSPFAIWFQIYYIRRQFRCRTIVIRHCTW